MKTRVLGVVLVLLAAGCAARGPQADATHVSPKTAGDLYRQTVELTARAQGAGVLKPYAFKGETVYRFVPAHDGSSATAIVDHQYVNVGQLGADELLATWKSPQMTPESPTNRPVVDGPLRVEAWHALLTERVIPPSLTGKNVEHRFRVVGPDDTVFECSVGAIREKGAEHWRLGSMTCAAATEAGDAWSSPLPKPIRLDWTGATLDAELDKHTIHAVTLTVPWSLGRPQPGVPTLDGEIAVTIRRAEPEAGR